MASPKKVARNAGIKIRAIGIKNLKFSSNVKEIVIQYKLDKKYPNPKNQPKKKVWFFLANLFFFKDINKK